MTDRQLEVSPLIIIDWGLLDYDSAFERQARLVQSRLEGDGVDLLALVEHPATVTLGRRATDADLHFPETLFAQRHVTLKKINRGGLATAHEPGQLVAYPIIALKKKDLRWFADRFLQVVIDLLADYGVRGERKEGEPGVWVSGKKICSFGIALKKWISSHGIALNVNNSLKTFNMIVPCGQPTEIMTSLSQECGHSVDMEELKERFVEHFCTVFAYTRQTTN
ncbi:MAG: lipoyl(octanoyl) transferase [Desulfuromonas sp.]|nr:MAG: lipoyl(octanoyl) transferase [Desulfuromonas sp.]